jgi:hypothetical protein
VSNHVAPFRTAGSFLWGGRPEMASFLPYEVVEISRDAVFALAAVQDRLAGRSQTDPLHGQAAGRRY